MISARSSIGLPVIDQQDHVIGTAESWLIDAKTKTVEGLLIGQTDKKRQGFLPLLCIEDIGPGVIQAIHTPVDTPQKSQRIIGLPAKTTLPNVLVGFVRDCLFDQSTGLISTVTIHQVVRSWHVPMQSVVTITPQVLLIDTDSTVKLQLTPYPAT